jgi:uncharacterized Zn-binding protein involved in type VI secretion
MALTVYAEGLGFFHKGSNGKGVAPGDVCLSPPPPPTGPAPVPYVNTVMASDLAEGSKSVKIDGQPTALEDKSYVSTSSGDEGGTQGGNVITHKTKGKGFFKLWSFTVKVEGKGVCRHDDMMAQNCASTPPGCVDMKALTDFLLKEEVDLEKPCDKPYDRKGMGLGKPIPEQYEKVRGGPCWECVRDLPKGDYAQIVLKSGKVVSKISAYVSGRKDKQNFTPDHQPPLNTAWYMGGCHMQPSPEAFKEWANSPQAVKPHCQAHSNSQGGQVGAVTSGQSGQSAFNAVVSFLGF